MVIKRCLYILLCDQKHPFSSYHRNNPDIKVEPFYFISYNFIWTYLFKSWCSKMQSSSELEIRTWTSSRARPRVRKKSSFRISILNARFVLFCCFGFFHCPVNKPLLQNAVRGDIELTVTSIPQNVFLKRCFNGGRTFWR